MLEWMRIIEMRNTLVLIVAVIWSVVLGGGTFCDAAKPRLLITTDIGGDPDDQQSMVRLLLYANEFEMEGLVASASGTPGELKQAITRPDLIHEMIDAYGKVRENLAQHADGYPTADRLHKLVKSGNPRRGKPAVGEGHDTEGSRWIIKAADRLDERPLNIAIWGGQTDLAQALYRVKNDRSEADYQAFLNRIRVYDIADQDRIFDWMMTQHPGLFYVLNKSSNGNRLDAAFRGMYLEGDVDLTSRQWIERHIHQKHGPLGALFPMKTWTSPNPHGVMKEGDTPSWFFFLPNGLNIPEHPEWGGWGGRFAKDKQGIYRDALDKHDGRLSARWTVARWRPAFQNDFAARADWCVRSKEEANHPPKITCIGIAGQEVVTISSKSNQPVELSHAGSIDPDGDDLTYNWQVDHTASSSKAIIETSAAAKVIPQGEPGDEIHVILTVEDNGDPKLTSYRRIVITIE
ncbi:DUF1593 domain-containing protein [Bremerella cremea]|uniref:DUF1593 domain-containing protein n=2 Tax=Pirellulales TaxID=2691354 RepID=A0A2S8FL29_9BACT|nr:hypothetical protein C5Y83_21300 [Blastopirellula marina]RCS45797.1 DUF1593 domain-containing protein [Bremerella cremea]